MRMTNVEQRTIARAAAVKALTQRVQSSRIRCKSAKYLAFNKGFSEFSKGSRER